MQDSSAKIKDLLGVPEGIVVGQLHELVDEVRLIDVTGNGTQLFVGGETLPGRGERIRYVYRKQGSTT